ncbi:MAG: CRISPR-associated protein Csx3 [Alkalinema sp. CAN_BIN05]|nr:CRISPR-associated protein Csx3 [Alkalinema sp. CAN_BIN05]
MTTYLMSLEALADGALLRVVFGTPAQNDQIVRDAVAGLEALVLRGGVEGRVLRVNGPMSLPVAFAVAHGVGHLFGVVAIYDPKLGGKYVVAISHDPGFAIGDLLD